MTTTDVNTQFDTNRASQIQSLQDAVRRNQEDIAAFDSGEAQRRIDAEIAGRVERGEIRDNGNGTYTALTGWDRNETFRIQRATRPGELTLVLPESGLDEGTGYFAQPEWHGLGTVIPGGISDVEKVLELSGLGYEVVQRKVRYMGKTGKDLREVPGSFVNTRDDTGDPLGVVGARYVPFQNRDAFAFLQELVDNHDVKFASAAPLDGGSRVFISVELPDTVVLDIPGLPDGDPIRPYVAVFNTHDGSGLFRAVVTPWRPRCKNTERLALREAHTSWGVRHTKSAPDRAAEAARQLGLARKYFDQFKAEQEVLARVDIELDQFNELIASLYPEPAEVAEGHRKLTAREAGIRERRETALRGIFRDEAAQVGRTAFAAERAVTNYLDHGVNRRQGSADSLAAARASAILEGADDDRKSAAHRQLIKLAA